MLNTFFQDNALLYLERIKCLKISAMKKLPNTERRRKFAWHFAFAKKDGIIRNLEIVIACVIAFIAGAGMYGTFN